MLTSIKELFTKNLGLKFVSLILALTLWVYTVSELKKGSEEETRLLNSILPRESMAAKKLIIRPIFVGKPRWKHSVAVSRTVVVPEFCIVVGTKDLIDKLRYAYTTPIDISGVSKPFSRSIPLNPIAPGIYMEETLVQVTVPVEKSE